MKHSSTKEKMDRPTHTDTGPCNGLYTADYYSYHHHHHHHCNLSVHDIVRKSVRVHNTLGMSNCLRCEKIKQSHYRPGQALRVPGG